MSTGKLKLHYLYRNVYVFHEKKTGLNRFAVFTRDITNHRVMVQHTNESFHLHMRQAKQDYHILGYYKGSDQIASKLIKGEGLDYESLNQKQLVKNQIGQTS